MSEHIQISDNGAVREIAFARPEKKNALSNAMYRAARACTSRRWPFSS